MRVLFLGAHTDDEISSAGTLAKFDEEGHEIFVAAFSFCEESTRALGYDEDTLRDEFSSSMACLGIKGGRVFTHSYPVRHFPAHRQDILERLVEFNKLIEPHLVLIPNTADMHQDHQVISAEGRRAFARSILLGYETARKFLPSFHMCYVRLSSKHWMVKEKCMRCYESQSSRPGTSVHERKLLAELRGLQAGCEIAEAFEVMRFYW